MNEMEFRYSLSCFHAWFISILSLQLENKLVFVSQLFTKSILRIGCCGCIMQWCISAAVSGLQLAVIPSSLLNQILRFTWALAGVQLLMLFPTTYPMFTNVNTYIFISSKREPNIMINTGKSTYYKH